MLPDNDSLQDENVTNPSLLQKLTEHLNSFSTRSTSSVMPQSTFTFSGAPAIIRQFKLLKKRLRKSNDAESSDDTSDDESEDSDDDSDSSSDSSNSVSSDSENKDDSESKTEDTDEDTDEDNEKSNDDSSVSAHTVHSSSESDADSYPIPDLKTLSFMLRTHSLNSHIRRQLQKLSSSKVSEPDDQDSATKSETLQS